MFKRMNCRQGFADEFTENSRIKPSRIYLSSLEYGHPPSGLATRKKTANAHELKEVHFVCVMTTLPMTPEQEKDQLMIAHVLDLSGCASHGLSDRSRCAHGLAYSKRLEELPDWTS
jgi:hypothetical protein